MTIERIDNDLGYSPENCTWITRAEQNKHRRNNHYVYYNGNIYTLNSISTELHFNRTNYRKLEKRYNSSQIAIEHILSVRKAGT